MKDKADVFIPSKYVIPTDFKVTNGCVPDQEVLRKDYNGDFKPQLDAAIEYIKNKH